MDYRNTIVIKASMESLVSKVDAMTTEQRDDYIANFVKNHGVQSTLDMVTKTLRNLTATSRQAALYEGLNEKKETPSQLSQKINAAGDWGYLLTLLLMIGTAGASDNGAGWGEVFKGFALTIGSGFLSWCLKKLSSYVK